MSSAAPVCRALRHPVAFLLLLGAAPVFWWALRYGASSRPVPSGLAALCVVPGPIWLSSSPTFGQPQVTGSVGCHLRRELLLTSPRSARVAGLLDVTSSWRNRHLRADRVSEYFYIQWKGWKGGIGKGGSGPHGPSGF